MESEVKMSSNLKRDLIIINLVLLGIFEFFLGLVYFEWYQSINIKMNCIVSSGIITIIAIILFALGIGNKNKRQIVYGGETLVLAAFTLLAYYILTTIQSPFMIGNISIYTVIPFVLFFVYYIVKIVVISKK